jgi:hypothetical protein
MNGREYGRRVPDLIYGMIPAFNWKDWEEQRKTSSSTDGVLAETRTGISPDISQERYRSSQFVRYQMVYCKIIMHGELVGIREEMAVIYI